MDDSHLKKSSAELEEGKAIFIDGVVDDWEKMDESDWEAALAQFDDEISLSSDSSETGEDDPIPPPVVVRELTLEDRLKLSGVPKAARRYLVGEEELAELFIEHYRSSRNPCVPLEILVELKKLDCLGIEAKNYNPRHKMIAGDMIFTFYFFTRGVRKVWLGEFHVHWNRPKDARGEAGTPGWKRGKSGKKVPVSNMTVFKALMGDFWGRDKSTGGTPEKL